MLKTMMNRAVVITVFLVLASSLSKDAVNAKTREPSKETSLKAPSQQRWELRFEDMVSHLLKRFRNGAFRKRTDDEFRKQGLASQQNSTHANTHTSTEVRQHSDKQDSIQALNQVGDKNESKNAPKAKNIGQSARQSTFTGNVVQLSIGCTGTLISPKHVLTAAHCLHDGVKFREAAKQLKVLLAAGGKWAAIDVGKMQVPKIWIRLSRMMKRVERAAFDYAVITLKSQADQFRHTEFSIPNNPQKEFVDKMSTRSEMRYYSYRTVAKPMPVTIRKRTRCRVQVFTRNLIISNCGAVKGDSGSAVLTTEDGSTFAIGGVLSSILKIPGGYITVAARMTVYKMRDICQMLSAEYRVHPSCWKWKSKYH